ATPAAAKRFSADPDVVSWGDDDAENPQNWGKMYRWTITAVVGFMTVNATFASSAPSAAVPLIAQEFGVSDEVATLTTSIYLVGYVFGPAFWGPGSEILGRRLVLILTMAAFGLATVGQALAPDIGVFLGTRALAGFFAVAPLVNGGGVVADIWDPHTRGIATTVFSTMIFLGPVLGPIVGGFIIPSPLGWRAVFWVVVAFAACSTLLALLVLPETHAPTLMAHKARRLRTLLPSHHARLYAPSERVVWTAQSLLDRTLLRPFKMLVVEPILLLVTIYISIVYGCLYSLFESVPLIFTTTRSFTPSQTGLTFLALGLGALLSALIDLDLVHRYPALLATWRGHPPPEKRLYGAMLAGPVFVGAIFSLGWTGYNPDVSWVVPALSLVFVGFSVSLVFNSFMTYLVDTYLVNTASAFAALTIVRSAVGAAFPLFILQLFRALGINIACTLIGAVGILLAPIPFVFFRYGARIRARSEFAPCLDLKIAKEIEMEKQAAALAGSGSV
ncbi:MFS polyamine transporter, partial [Vararia minispora EC-137]